MNVMSRAWTIAKDGVSKFGGKVKEYFATSLKLAWKELKEMAELVKLEGSEKQIAWANSIRKDVLEVFAAAKPGMVAKFEAKIEKKHADDPAKAERKRVQRHEEVDYYESLLTETTSAKFFIDNFGTMFKQSEKADRDFYLKQLSTVMASRLQKIAQNDSKYAGLVAQTLGAAYRG